MVKTSFQLGETSIFDGYFAAYIILKYVDELCLRQIRWPLDTLRFGPCRRPPCGPRSDGSMVVDDFLGIILFSKEVGKQSSGLQMTLNEDLGKWRLWEVVV